MILTDLRGWPATGAEAAAVAVLCLVTLVIVGEEPAKCHCTPALAACQPRCECPETISLSSSNIHMSDEELGCPGNYRQGIIAQWAKFQGNLQKH